ncbi:MAG: hypothetical protein K0Q49_873 [Haloplasmataceae bacterium]|jgi:N utilization substance protein B|nr:hypothetical protein [Haloplasmataceae bacterium]
MNRKKEREIIVLSLYSLGISGNDVLETINYILEQNKVEEPVTEYINNSITGVIAHQDELDMIITKNLENYTIERLSYIDLAIIRFATYELIHAVETHFAIVINEAIEITKKYSDVGDNKAASFNNSLLDKIKNDLNLA